MKHIHTSKKSGFTLLEILLVVAAIGILAAIVIVAINPQRQLAKVRNSERQSEITALSDAIYQYNIDNNGDWPGGLSSADTEYAIIAQGESSCDTGATDPDYEGSAGSETDLASDLTPTYISEIPSDPSVDVSGCSGYEVERTDSGNASRITIQAPWAENGETIEVTR